jgi:GNAT superfamily N-acetyltransferase
VPGPTRRSITIQRAREVHRDQAHAFHRQHNEDGLLWPREARFFHELISEQELFLVFEEAVVVGICYYTRREDGRWEIGGLYVEEPLRRCGVAHALASVAIATLFVTSRSDTPLDLIALVHEQNDDPRRLLGEAFEETDETEVDTNPPVGINTNKNGEAVGNVFGFRTSALNNIADWLDRFSGGLQGKSGDEVQLTIDADVWKDRATLVPELRKLARGQR